MLEKVWRGANYNAHRILILARSSWGIGDMTDADYVEHWLRHWKFLENPTCETCVRCGKARHPGEKDYPRDRLNDALTKMMVDWKDVTPELRRDAWSKIAFTNFILSQRETRSAKDQPGEKDFEEGAKALPARLEALRPGVCLVLTDEAEVLLRAARPALKHAGVEVVPLLHPTMILKGGGTVRKLVRKEAWRKVQVAAA